MIKNYNEMTSDHMVYRRYYLILAIIQLYVVKGTLHTNKYKDWGKFRSELEQNELIYV